MWRKVGTLGGGPAPRYTHSGVSIGSQLIVYGGNTGCLKGDAYVLDVGNIGTGTFFGKLNRRRLGTRSLTYLHCLHAGDDVPTWKLVKSDPPLIPRAWHRAVVYNDTMYVFGGRTSDGNDNQVMCAALCAAGGGAAP